MRGNPQSSGDFSPGEIVQVTKVHYEDPSYCRQAVDIDGTLLQGPFLIKIVSRPRQKRAEAGVHKYHDGSYDFYGVMPENGAHPFFTPGEINGDVIHLRRVFARKYDAKRC